MEAFAGYSIPLHKESTVNCALSALSLFGENSRAALVKRLSAEGIKFTPAEFDAGKFCRVLEDDLGDGANFFFAKIINDLCEQQSESLESLGLAGRAKYLSYSQLLQELISQIEV